MKWMPGRALVEQPLAQLGGVLDAEPAHRRRVVGDRVAAARPASGGNGAPDSCSNRSIVLDRW